MELCAYREEDGPLLAALFYDTVHTVNAGDYTPEQLAAWAPDGRDLKAWDRSFRDHIALVAEEQGIIVGFADLDPTAEYLDRLYVHRSFQGRGVGTALCAALEGYALSCGAQRIETHASITARPFLRGGAIGWCGNSRCAAERCS